MKVGMVGKGEIEGEEIVRKRKVVGVRSRITCTDEYCSRGMTTNDIR